MRGSATRRRGLRGGSRGLPLVAGRAASRRVTLGGGLRRPGRAAFATSTARSPSSGPSATSTSRFTTGGGNRYDYWRVALDQFADEPLRGVGAGNYDRTYFLERRTTEDIRQPHSIELQTLGELGIVGGALLAVFLGAIAVGFARRAREAHERAPRSGLAVAAGGMFLVWLVHTSVDWLHLIPGVTGIALCAAAVLVGPVGTPARGSHRSVAKDRHRSWCAAWLVLAGAILVGRAALADRYLNEGRDVLVSDPAAALVQGEGLSTPQRRAPSGLLPRVGRRGRGSATIRRARAALVEATRREPHDFVTWALLGDLATRREEYRQALADYRRALALNPRAPSLRVAVRRARARARTG